MESLTSSDLHARRRVSITRPLGLRWNGEPADQVAVKFIKPEVVKDGPT